MTSIASDDFISAELNYFHARVWKEAQADHSDGCYWLGNRLRELRKETRASEVSRSEGHSLIPASVVNPGTCPAAAEAVHTSPYCLHLLLCLSRQACEAGEGRAVISSTL